jgi:hypothetical protein
LQSSRSPLPLRAPRRRSPHSGTAVACVAAGLIAVAALGCRETFRLADATPAAAATRVAQLFESIADRYADVLVSPRYEVARVRIAESALTPSKVFDDTAVFDARARVSNDARLLYVSGGMAEGRYHLDTRPSLTPTDRPGDTRHTIALERLAPNVYRWDTNVDLAIGTISAADVSGALTMLFRSAEGRNERELRDDYQTAFPRAAAAFGRGFSIDSLWVTPSAGGTSVALTVGFHPDQMRAAFPALAGYLDKYLGPAKYHFTLVDRSGAPLLDVLGRDRAATLRYRVRNGALVTLAGEARPWPDSLELRADLSLKVKHFTVGFHDLVTSFVIDDAGRDRSWTINARREPDWDLPLLTEHFIRSPLRRPFLGEGALFQLSVRDSAGQQSVFARRTRLDVQESTILRFIGSLAAHAIGDLDTRVEAEEDRYLHDGFAALRADLGPLSARWGAGNSEGPK